MSTDLEIRTLTFDRAGVIIALPDALKGPLPKMDWGFDGSTITVSPVAVPRTTTAPTVPAKVKIKIKKDLPVGTRIRATLATGYPLAGVAPTTLLNPSKGTRAVDLHIDLPNLNTLTVGEYTVALAWEVRKPGAGETWTNFDTTSHRVFVLADEPVVPWGRTGVANRAVPWTAVLERACRWATGHQTPADCVSAITKQAYGLGGQVINHGGPNNSTTIEYGDGSSFDNGNGGFFLKNFLDTADLKKNSDGFLNCSDLAGAVALLSSAIGCSVGIARIAPTPPAEKFKTHFMQLIGVGTPARTDFTYHEFVATLVINTTNTNTHSLGANAWDACAKLDDTAPPATSLPSASSLAIPANWARRAGTAPVYETQLLPSPQQLTIDLIPEGGIMFPEEVPQIQTIVVDKFLLEREHSLDKLLDPVPVTNPASPATIGRIRAALLRNTTGFRERVTWATNHPYNNVVARLRPRAGPQTMRMSFAIAGTDAQKILLRWAARYVSKLVVIRQLGDAAFHAPQSDSIVMRVRDTVIQLTGDGEHLPTVDIVAKELERAVRAAYP